MSHQQKSKEELLLELQVLQEQYNGLKKSVDDNLLVQKDTEEALRISEERYNLAMEASNDGLFDWDLESNSIYYSPSWKQMIGYGDDELPNDFSVWEKTTLASDVERSWKLQQKLISKEIERFVLEFKMKHKDGRWIDILSQAKAIFNKDGKAIRIVGIHTDISARKHAEIRLQDEKEQMKTILNLVSDPIFVKDDNHIITMANKAFLDVFDLEENKVIGFTLAEEVPENEKEQFMGIDRKVLDTGIADLREEKLTIDGETRTIITSKTRFVDDFGNKFLVGSIHDITVQNNAIEALAKSEDRLNLALETGSIGAWDLNLDDHSANRTLIHDQIFGYKTLLSEWTFEMFLEHVLPEDRDYVETAFTNAVESVSNWSFECRIMRIDKKIRWIKAVGQHSFNSEGKPIMLSGIVQDISEHKLTEIELLEAMIRAEENEAKFKEYTQSSPVAIYTTDDKGNCVFANHKWLEFAGLSLEESLGTGWVQALHPEDKDFVFENWNKSVQSNGNWYFEYRFMSKNGEVTFVEGRAKPLYDKERKFIGYLGSNVDITDRKRAESLLKEKNEELILAKEKAEESDRLKSAFLANMSHEIRTPMNSIMGFTELLNSRNLTSIKKAKYIGIILKSGDRMLNIIDDIMDISKIEAGLMAVEVEEFDINEQIDYLYHIFKSEVEAKGLNISFIKGLVEKEAKINTDRDKFIAILSNLIKNAIKYTEKGIVEYGYQLIKNANGSKLKFFVKDTGIGICKDRQEAIFERFVQADIHDVMAREGAGLGLAITKSHIEMLNGEIWVNSKEGEGSTFYFTLPFTIDSKVKTSHQNSSTSD